MNPSKVTHKILKRYGSYVVYRMETTDTAGSGSPVYRTNDYEDARKKLYELNGWKYKPKDKESL